MVKHGRPRIYDLFNMPLSLNLRHDLARMSAAQLMERVEQTWQAYAEAEAKAWPHKLFASFRGPIRHPSAYAFLSWVGVSSGIRMGFRSVVLARR